MLNSHLFEDLGQVWEITYEWLIAYNERRPYDVLGGLPPKVFRKQQIVKNPTLNYLLYREVYVLVYYQYLHLTGKERILCPTLDSS